MIHQTLTQAQSQTPTRGIFSWNHEPPTWAIITRHITPTWAIITRHLTPTWAVFLILAGFFQTGQALDLMASGGFGWTHYKAEDLNKFMVLLERKTNAGGFNPYNVQGFDGHVQQAWSVGVLHGPWRVALDAEFWTERFTQSQVAFDMGNPNREYRVSCVDLAAPGYTSEDSYGCIFAQEYFLFLPLTLQVSHVLKPHKLVALDAGYGFGIMAGTAEITVKTDFFGNSGVDDEVKYKVDPGINLVHKFFLDIELTPCRWFGIQLRNGYRISKLKKFELSNKKGSSHVFANIFDNPKEGDALYFESYQDESLSEEIVIGKATDIGRTTKLQLVQGDFTGWFIHGKINLYWRGL